MSQLPSHPAALPRSPGRALGRAEPAFAAARGTLCKSPLSRDALRAAVVRCAGIAREGGATAADLTEALDAALAPALARFPAALAADLRVHIAWWAAHGYHRAD